jgi:hypothetical protein
MKDQSVFFRGILVGAICLFLATFGPNNTVFAQSLQDATGASGMTAPEETHAKINAIPYQYDRGVMAIVKSHASEMFSCIGTEKVVFRFRISAWDDTLHRVDPEAFTVTAVDAYRVGEKIRIKVYKESNPTQFVVTSAISPKAATIGLSPVVNGDNIYVEVNYPTGYLPGYTGSGFILSWVLHNTGWIK